MSKLNLALNTAPGTMPRVQSDDAVSTRSGYAMRGSFAAGDIAPAALKFSDALVEWLSGGRRKH